MGPPWRPQPPPTDYPRHIILPFNLRDEGHAIYDERNLRLLSSIFLGTCGVSTHGGFLHVLQRQMPRKP